MKQLKFIFASALVAAVLVFAACKKDSKDDPVVNPTTETPDPTGSDEPVSTLPEVEGTEGAITLVVKFPSLCDGYSIIFAGDYKESVDNGGTWDAPNGAFSAAREFEAIGDGWYKIVMHVSEGAESISGRPLQYSAADHQWSYDWSHSADMLHLEKGGADDIFADSGFGEINLNIAAAYAEDAEVIYIIADEWNLSPCVERLAAGTYTFTINLPEALPAGAELYFTGNFPENEWGASDRLMTKVSDTQYKWTGEIPENFECKVFYVLDGTQTWQAGSNIVPLAGETLEYSIEWPAPEVPAE